MALNAANVELLIRLRRADRIPDHAAVIEIGAQQLDNSVLRARSRVAQLGELFGVTDGIALPDPIPTQVTAGGHEHLSERAPAARMFWEWLGLDYASIDVDGSPGSIRLDLNFDETPRAARGKYQVVTNFGTTEHVINQLNAFKVIHDLAAPDGVMIHNLPAQGFINHGFFNYTPQFFWMLAKSNNYDWCHFDYQTGGNLYELPRNIVAEMSIFGPDAAARTRGYRLVDFGLVAVLQKRGDEPFVAPPG